MERSPESLVYQGSLTRLNSFLVFGVRYKDCGVFGTTFIESSYDSSSLPSACCRNKRNKTKRNLIWAFYSVPKHWRPGRVLSTLFKTDTTCVTSTKCPSREESSKVSKERQGQNSGCQLTLVKMMALNQNQIWHSLRTHCRKVTRPSFFGGVPSYFEALWYPHLYFYRKSNT